MPAFGDDREPFPANTTAAIRDRAFLAVSPERLGHVNLYLDQRVLRAGEQLGPAFQDLRAPRPSVGVAGCFGVSWRRMNGPVPMPPFENEPFL